MVSLPLVTLQKITAEVASTACLGKNLIAFGSGQPASRHSILPFDLAFTARLPKFMQSLHKVGIRLKFIGYARFVGG
jgi:hypothetical protein